MAKSFSREDRDRPDDQEDERGLYNSTGGSGLVFRKSLVQALTFLVIVLLALLVKETVHILLLVFAGVLLAVLLDFFGRQVMRLPRVPHWLAITIVLIVLALLIAGVILLVVPRIMQDTAELTQQIDEAVKQMMQWLRNTAGGQVLVDQLSSLNGQVSDGEGLWTNVAGVFTSTLGAFTGTAIILVVGIFIAYNPTMYKVGLFHLVPMDHRVRFAKVLAATGMTLRWWLLGQLISMVVLAVTTWIMLALLGVPQALILALITGLLTFVPYLGPLIALIPILLISLLEGPMLALTVFVLYMCIQNVEGNVLMPIIFHRTAHIPPALGVISQILFGGLFGVLGFILAIPLMAVIVQFVKMVYVEDVLGDKSLEEESS